jgi:hypothetical protein
MAIRTFTVTRTKIDSSVPFWKTHFINTQPDPTIAAKDIADLETWIKAQPGIISYNDGAEDGSVLVFHVEYNDAIVPDFNELIKTYPTLPHLPGMAQAYYRTPAVAQAIVSELVVS